jgi:uncharacterized Tic20 family protein
MAKPHERAGNSGVKPLEQPAGPNDGRGTQTTWVSEQIGKDARMWAMLCHLAGLAGLSPVLPGIGSAVGPFVIWQLKRDEFPFVDEQGRRAVNFQLSMLLYGLAGSLVCLITCIGTPLIPVVLCVAGTVDVVFVLIAAVKANRGEHYRYLLAIRFFK